MNRASSREASRFERGAGASLRSFLGTAPQIRRGMHLPAVAVLSLLAGAEGFVAAPRTPAAPRPLVPLTARRCTAPEAFIF